MHMHKKQLHEQIISCAVQWPDNQFQVGSECPTSSTPQAMQLLLCLLLYQ